MVEQVKDFELEDNWTETIEKFEDLNLKVDL